MSRKGARGVLGPRPGREGVPGKLGFEPAAEGGERGGHVAL